MTIQHTTPFMWRRGLAAVAMGAFLTTMALTPVTADAQSDVPAPLPQADSLPSDGPQDTPQVDPYWLQFRSGTASIGESRGEDLKKKLASLADPSDSKHIIVQFDGPVTARDRRLLEQSGIELQTFLSSNAYFALIGASDDLDVNRAASVSNIRAVSDVQPIWKLHDFLAAGEMPTWAIVDEEYVQARLEAEQMEDAEAAIEQIRVPQDPMIVVYVSYHPDVALMPDAWLSVIELGGRPRSFLKSINAMVVELPYSQINTLLEKDAVQFIEPALPKFAELNNSNRARVGADTLQQAPYGLDGSGVTVFVYDGGEALASHQDFTGRITVIDSSGVSDHSTHVAGTIGGDGAASGGLYRGMAPAVTLISAGFEQPGGLQQGFLYTDPGDLEADYTAAIQTHGAVIANNSIGTNTAPNGFPCDWEGNYGNTSALIDAIVRGSLGAPMRIVWANGNERQTSRCLGVEGYQSPYHSTAPPACAKNHITVGALNSNDDSVTSFTSFGPTDDGRIKPDVSAPGCQSDDDFDVTSTSSSGGYTGKCGTSMASPTVCGIGALMIQAHRMSARGSADMLPSTLKAVLANTAEDLGRPGPDYEYGHGSVRGIAAVDLIEAGHYREGSVSQGETYNAVVIVGPGDTELRITLAWDDVPAAPLVIPSLVNDLDLAIYDSNGTRHYPFILDPQNPTANATATTENRLDNIEQIVIPNPTPGAYRVEVIGHSVPQGPQNFSLAATPSLLTCASNGFASVGNVKYACESTANLQVIDCDLNTDDLIVDTVNVTITSDTEPGGEVVTLTEVDPAAATFTGTIQISETDSVGVVHVSPGDTLTLTYIDADDGMGGSNVVVNSFATVDCSVPSLVSTSTVEINPRDATVNVQVDEPAMITINYGSACGALNDSVSGFSFLTSQNLVIDQLLDDTTYYYNVEMTDQAGNMTVDDNGGACYSFTTPEIPDFFTEQFAGGFDLSGISLEFTPDANVDGYVVCQRPICLLPVDPSGGTVIPPADSTSTQVSLTGGETVELYGQTYGSFYIGTNGYVTFTASDTDSSETLTDHFDTARISMLFDDLDPTEGGEITWAQLVDRAVVTWYQVPQDGVGDANTFQLEMYFDGRIVMSWLDVNPAVDCIVGLSEGQGVNVDFFESDLTIFNSCGPQPPQASSVFAQVPSDRVATIDLVGCDTAGGSLTYIITSLPAFELRDAGDNTIINSVPFTLLGDQVTYQTTGGYVGPDAFDYVVDDGGVPPDGGESNEATVTLDVLPVLGLPFADDFESLAARGGGFDPNKWLEVAGATIDNQGIAPPSPTNAARFNGDPSGGDVIATQLIDLSGESAVRVSYYYQQTGNGESPDSGDDLFIEYLNDSGAWIVLAQYDGSGPDMTTFQYAEHLLSADAFHNSFRLRISNTATAGAFDDWFVDNITIGVADAPAAGTVNVSTPVDTPTMITLAGSDPNGDPIEYTIRSLPPNGTLRDAGNDAPINSTPYTLVSNGDAVIYTPLAGVTGMDGFTYDVSDGTYNSNIANVNIDVVPVLALPFFEDFEGGLQNGSGFDPNHWSLVENAEVNDVGLNEPSPTMSANFNGNPSAGDSLTSHAFNLSGENAVRVSYWYQQTGGGDSPESGDDLFVEYLNNVGTWSQLAMYSGADPDMTGYVFAEHLLPSDALHSTFRLRIRSTGTSGAYDDWFVDDISVTAANAPTASDVYVATPVGTAVSIAFDATDPNGDILDYIVESLPANGTLRDAGNNAVINATPYILVGNGDTVLYSPDAGYNGLDPFQYSVTDGSYASSIATANIDVGGPIAIHTFPLDSDPGWTTQGDWAFGAPAGLSGDPSSGYTGSNVYGYNLNGDYPNNMAATQYLTTGPLDLTNVTDASLRFRRWLGVESASYDHANIQVSNDGVGWTTVWDHTGPTLNELSWSAQEYDISAVADNQATVYIRWGMGTTDGSVVYHGWNIDDVEIWGRVPPDSVPGDTNDDGVVDIFDLLNILDKWGPCPGCPEDLDGNGAVDIFDLLIVLDNWTIPGRSAPVLAGDINNIQTAKDALDALTTPDDAKVYVNNGLLVPADHGGYFEVEQNYRQTARGELGIEIAGRLPVDEADILVVPDRAKLNGKLTVWLSGDFVPTPGDTFKVLVAGAIEGEFDDVLLPDLTKLLGKDVQFELVYDSSSVTLRVPGAARTPAAAVQSKRSMLERGDLDGNGRLTVNDVLSLINAWGDNPGSPADLNGDDVVDSQDLAILLQAPIGPRHSALEEEVRK